MKRLFYTVIATIIVMLFIIAGVANAQTSYYELKLYNTANKLVTGKDVDLYQGVSKIYDLTESSSIPGVYTHSAVAHGEYDVYVNSSLFKSQVWIGAEKVSDVVDLFRMYDPDPDTLEMVGHIKATSFEGDGSKLIGVPGSLLEANDDLELKADADSDQIGDIEFMLGDTVFAAIERSSTYGDVSLIVGRRNSVVTDGVGIAGFNPGIQHHSSTSSSLTANTFTSPGNAFQGFLQFNNTLGYVVLGSAWAGNPTGVNYRPVVISAGAKTVVRLDTLLNVVVQGDANDGVPAAYTHDVFQIQADTSVGMQAVRIYGGGTGARFVSYEIDEINNIAKFVSTKTGTVPGDSAYRMIFWVGGAGGNKMEIYPSSLIKVNGKLYVAIQNDTLAAFIGDASRNPGDSTWVFLRSGILAADKPGVSPSYIRMGGSEAAIIGTGDNDRSVRISGGSGTSAEFYTFGTAILEATINQLGLTLGSNNSLIFTGAGAISSTSNGNITLDPHGTGIVVSSDLVRMPNPVELPGGAWFGVQRDTIAGMIPCVSFSDDTAYYDLGVFPHAVSVDSVWLDVLTEDTDGDSARFVLGSRQVDFGEAYAGAFTTQNSSYADMGAGDLRTKIRFTTAVSLDANHRLVLKLYRDNAIDDNTAGRVKLAGAIVFGKGLK